jgi:hypothetical protein
MPGSVALDRPDLFSVRFQLPPAHCFRLPPDPNPPAFSPPAVERSWLRPFNIPPDVFQAMIQPSVPITIALLYATTVLIVNRINQRRGNKPWAISKTRAFKAFVILHNVFLAIYSVWTLIGMSRAFRDSLPSLSDKPFFVTLADSMCKITGPRGLGNAAIYDPFAKRWNIQNPEYKLTAEGTPDPTDVGRLWNGGLAYYGWLFYLSKFYEVFDTFIILAKGKRSSTLQTYHHTGAMMCMWAGIRYMGGPIWIFTIFNSAIHALMYTYYTLTALSIKVPLRLKQTLTSMQITQFIIGFTLASLHYFISYSLPVPVAHHVPVGPLANVPAERLMNDTAAGLDPWLKKLAFRAAGAEGVAENVANEHGALFGADGARAAQATMGHQEIRYTFEPKRIHCMDTTGHAFALSLNVLYLLPLTFLFVRFFVRSYRKRQDTRSARTPGGSLVEKAGKDAFKGVSREIRHAVMEMHGGASETTTDVDSGTSTPHPEAYEANIDSIMNRKQLRVEQREGRPTAHPTPVRLATDAAGTNTPKDERAYEANVEDVMSRKEQQIDDKLHQRARRPSRVEYLPSSKDGISTPLDERGYEANVEDVMNRKEHEIDDQLHQPARRPSRVEYLPSSKDGISTPLDERGYEANVEDVMDSAQKEVEEHPEQAAPRVDAPQPSSSSSSSRRKRRTKSEK